jgi:hypothetical protein
MDSGVLNSSSANCVNLDKLLNHSVLGSPHLTEIIIVALLHSTVPITEGWYKGYSLGYSCAQYLIVLRKILMNIMQHAVNFFRENSVEALVSALPGLCLTELLSRCFPTSLHTIGIWNPNTGPCTCSCYISHCEITLF